MVTDYITIKKIMVEKQIPSVSELSRICNISRNTLSSILNGESQPSRAVMVKLVEVLDLSPSEAGDIFFAVKLRDAQ